MGMSTGGAGATGRRRGRCRASGRHAPMAEINVTPLVDVMLVLLIIFMVTAPLLTVGVPIELPETRAKQLEAQKKEPLTVTIDAKGQVFIQETKVTLETLVPKLKAITKSGYNERIYVRGDRRIDYGTMMKVMGRINAAGFRRVSLVTDLEDRF